MDYLKDENELFRQWSIYDMTLGNIAIIVVAIIINVYYINVEKIKTLDSIYSTNNSQYYPDVSVIPKIASVMFLYVAIIFVIMNYKNYEINISQESIKEEEDIESAYNSLLASFFATITAIITYYNVGKIPVKLIK